MVAPVFFLWSLPHLATAHHIFVLSNWATTTSCLPIYYSPSQQNCFLQDFLPEFVLGVHCQTSLPHAQPSVIFQHTCTLTRPSSIPSVLFFTVPYSPDARNKNWSKNSPVFTQSCYNNAYIHTYIHTCMHTCIHTYIHTYIRTYIHTYVHS